MFRTIRLRRRWREEKAYHRALVDSLTGIVDETALDEAREEIIAGEEGLAFELLFSRMYEADVRISHEHVERFIEVSRAMQLPIEEYDHLPALEAFPEDAASVTAGPLPPTPPSIREAAEAAS